MNILIFKGTVSVISSDRPCKDGNTRIKTVAPKSYSDRKCGIVNISASFSIASSKQGMRKSISHGESANVNNSLKKQNHWYLIRSWPGRAFKGTVVNQALPSLHGGSLEITLTVPLALNISFWVKICSKGNFSKFVCWQFSVHEPYQHALTFTALISVQGEILIQYFLIYF